MINGGGAKTDPDGNGTYQLRLSRFIGFRDASQIRQVKSLMRSAPWSVFEAPKEIIAAFLRAL